MPYSKRRGVSGISQRAARTGARLARVLILFGILVAWNAGQASATEPCERPAGCVVPAGRYFAAMPELPARRVLLFFHGFGSNALHELDMPELRQWANRAGAVLLIPDGLDARWSVIEGLAGARDEIAFAQTVLADARARMPLATLPVYASGFSLGASMVWKLACAGLPGFSGYIAFSGAFWEPAPVQCAALSAPLLHFHGTDDKVVPIEGRQVRSGRRQAPLEKALGAMAHTGHCGPAKTTSPVAGSPPGLVCEERLECAAGAITYCQHQQGHNFEVNWLGFAMDRLESRR